jgi:hypothetical protein
MICLSLDFRELDEGRADVWIIMRLFDYRQISTQLREVALIILASLLSYFRAAEIT